MLIPNFTIKNYINLSSKLFQKYYYYNCIYFYEIATPKFPKDSKKWQKSCDLTLTKFHAFHVKMFHIVIYILYCTLKLDPLSILSYFCNSLDTTYQTYTLAKVPYINYVRHCSSIHIDRGCLNFFCEPRRNWNKKIT